MKTRSLRLRMHVWHFLLFLMLMNLIGCSSVGSGLTPFEYYFAMLPASPSDLIPSRNPFTENDYYEMAFGEISHNYCRMTGKEKKHIIKETSEYGGNNFQCLRFMCWIAEEDPSIRMDLLTRWLTIHKTHGTLPPLEKVLPKLKKLLAFELEEEQFHRINEFIAAYKKICGSKWTLHFTKEYTQELSTEDESKILQPLIDQKELMGLTLFSSSEERIIKSLEQCRRRNSLVGENADGGHYLARIFSATVSNAIGEIERAIDAKEGRACPAWQDINCKYTKQYYEDTLLLRSVYADAQNNVYSNLGAEHPNYNINKYLRYLKGSDTQLLRLLIYATSDDPVTRKEVMSQILCTEDKIPTLEELCKKLQFTLSSWNSEEQTQRMNELKDIYRHLNHEKKLRDRYHYNLDDGKGYWVLQELARNDILGESGLYSIPTTERKKLFANILKRKPFIPLHGEVIWIMIWSMETDPEIRKSLFEYGKLFGTRTGQILDRMNQNERNKRNEEIQEFGRRLFSQEPDHAITHK